jgi:Xaa-Pro aminopeptidase
MTRTIPVSGKYRQTKPFTMPFYALRMKLLKCLSQEHFETVYEVGKLMTSELLGLGLLDKLTCKTKTQTSLLTKYFMHGTSHHMGLDTHDYGVLTEPMQANMVFT